MSRQTPPRAKKVPFRSTVHNHTRTDDYHWMRDKEHPDVRAYLEEENAYTAVVMEGTNRLQEDIYNEIVGRIQENDQSAPIKRGDYFYYFRTEEEKQYRIYCRKKGSQDAEEEILLDLNEQAQGEYLGLGIFKVSPNQKLLAYSLDLDGSEEYKIFIKDLETGELLQDVIPNTDYSFEWGNDDLTFCYTIRDDAYRPYKVMSHRLGTSHGDDSLVYHEEDALFNVTLYKTKDSSWIVVNSQSIETSEQYLISADQPTSEVVLFSARETGVRYDVEHRDNVFYVRTNLNAPSWRLMTVSGGSFSQDNWEEMIVEREGVLLQGCDLFADYLVLYERANGLQRIGVHSFASGSLTYVEFDESTYSVYGEENPEYHSQLLRYSYESLTTPRSNYAYHMGTGESQLIKRRNILGGYDPNMYQSERIMVKAEDGVDIPVSIVYRKGIRRDDGNPTLLYAYGSYGVSLDPWFSIAQLSLLDRGFVFAIAHIRGGMEMGRSWYDQGKLLNKKNTFTDFIACGRELIARKYTKHDALAIMGGSAGGLLIGAVINMEPSLASVAVASVPFVDVMNTMLDESLPLTVGEYEEWGNPKDPTYYDYMLSYSPYDNVEEKQYPHILVTAGLNDPRVAYWEPAKWVAKLRDKKSDSNRLLLKVNMGAGHSGASGRYDAYKEIAFEYAFIIDTLESEQTSGVRSD